MATQKRQEEKNLKALRQLLNLPENKMCAECPEKSPAYANMSNNSFICTRCSGLL
jgi:dynactin complex subunit